MRVTDRISKILTPALSVLLMLSLPSCGGEGDQPSSWVRAAERIYIHKGKNPDKGPILPDDRKKTLVVGTTDFMSAFNPAFAETTCDMSVTANIFGFLIEPDFDARPIPGMADFTVSGDGLTYVLELKEGIRFSNGKPVTSKDVEFTLQVLCDPAYNGPVDMESIRIVGFDDYHNGISDSVSGIRTADDRTVEIRLEKPNAQAVWRFSTGVLCKEYYGSGYSKGKLGGIRELMDKPMGAGPYILAGCKPGESVTLEVNDHYYKGAPKIDKIVYSVTDIGRELDRVRQGEVDIDSPAVTGENIGAVKEQGFIDIYRFPTNGYGYVGLRLDDLKYSDRRVRQALITALNRKAVVEKVYGPYAEVLNIPQSKLSWAYAEEGMKTYDHDPDLAKKLLGDAGWIKDDSGRLVKDGRQFEIRFSAIRGHPVTDAMLPVMAHDYENLGINFTIEYTDWSALMNNVLGGSADMYFMAWDLAPDPDPSPVYMTGGRQNYCGYSNKEADALMRQALETTGFSVRKELYAKVYGILNEDVPCIWIYQRSDMWAVNGRVANFRVSPYRDWFFGIDGMYLR